MLKLLRWRVTIMDGAEWSQHGLLQHGSASTTTPNARSCLQYRAARPRLAGSAQCARRIVHRNAAVINGIVEVQDFPPPPPPPPLIAVAAPLREQMEVSAVELDGNDQADQQTGAGEDVTTAAAAPRTGLMNGGGGGPRARGSAVFCEPAASRCHRVPCRPVSTYSPVVCLGAASRVACEPAERSHTMEFELCERGSARLEPAARALVTPRPPHRLWLGLAGTPTRRPAQRPVSAGRTNPPARNSSPRWSPAARARGWRCRRRRPACARRSERRFVTAAGSIREGKFTEQVYSMIRDKRYHEARAERQGDGVPQLARRRVAHRVPLLLRTRLCLEGASGSSSSAPTSRRTAPRAGALQGRPLRRGDEGVPAVGDSEELSHKVMARRCRAPPPPRAASASGRPPPPPRADAPPCPSAPSGAAAQAAIKFEMDDLMNARAFIEQSCASPQPTTRRPATRRARQCALTPRTAGPTRPTPSSTTRA